MNLQLSHSDFLMFVSNKYGLDFFELITRPKQGNDRMNTNDFRSLAPGLSLLMEVSLDVLYKIDWLLDNYSNRSIYEWGYKKFDLDELLRFVEKTPLYTLEDIANGKNTDYEMSNFGVRDDIPPNPKTLLDFIAREKHNYDGRLEFYFETDTGRKAEVSIGCYYNDWWSSTLLYLYRNVRDSSFVMPRYYRCDRLTTDTHIEITDEHNRARLPIVSYVAVQKDKIHGELNPQVLALMTTPMKSIKCDGKELLEQNTSSEND